MKIEKTVIDGLLVFYPNIYEDERGFFFESYNEKRYFEAGLNAKFVQDNISKSSRGTVRGLHYQVGEFAQGKLCQVLSGEVLDVAVDIRFGSPTFGKYFSLKLNDKERNQLWIPPGFAHGFSVLSEEAVFMYKCSNFYSKKDERAIIYNDQDLNITWQIENPIISEKDKLAGKFKDIKEDFVFNK